MDATRRRIADELLARSREHDERQQDRLLRFRNLEPEAAEITTCLVPIGAGVRLVVKR